MQVRVLRPMRGRRVGYVFAAMPDGEANLLIKRGYVERYDANTQTSSNRGRKRTGNVKRGKKATRDSGE